MRAHNRRVEPGPERAETWGRTSSQRRLHTGLDGIASQVERPLPAAKRVLMLLGQVHRVEGWQPLVLSTRRQGAHAGQRERHDYG